jgi:hypothetical protein
MFDPITGQNHSGPVTTMLAMNEDRPRESFDEAQNKIDLGVDRPSHPAKRHIGVEDSVSCCLLLLLFPDVIYHSQVDDALHPKSFQILDSRGIRLRATKDKFIDFCEIENSLRYWQPAAQPGGSTAQYKG